ncbi:hypothetical protein NW762_003438 [Fusarium torreyae]|uniref:Uncharacterized protein n=1 Tax=Fusarium torreyae TaxID=1237075 RepID=A0A9W8VLM8_9HYPO|nr:hypothetical protein NW762_003438 [Fusarium torreyae]
MASSADRVFHTLELAQQIVYELEIKDLFKALPITKALWTSNAPDYIWREHLSRLGFLDYALQTSYCLRTLYLRISQTIDAINHGVNPVSTLRKVEKPEGQYDFVITAFEEDMDAPLVSRTSNQDFSINDIYVLNEGGLQLLCKNNAFQPIKHMLRCSSVLGYENNSIVIRRLADWSVTARFDLCTIFGTDNPNIAALRWGIHEGYFIREKLFQKQRRGNLHTLFEIWDKQASKRGEFSYPGNGGKYFYSRLGRHYMTAVSVFHARTWNLDSLELVFQYTLSDEDRDEQRYFKYREGIVFLCDGSDIPTFERYWPVDGRQVPRKRAEMIRVSRPGSMREFSDGSRILWSKWLTLYNSEGDKVRRFDLKQNWSEGCYLNGGILFDQFFYSIFHFEESSCASLIVYSKTGDELTSMLLDRQGRSFTCSVDVLGRLVIAYETNELGLDELEIIDFRGILD